MITGMRAPGSSFAGYKLTLGVFNHSFFHACSSSRALHFANVTSLDLAAVLQSGLFYPCFINEETEFGQVKLKVTDTGQEGLGSVQVRTV